MSAQDEYAAAALAARLERAKKFAPVGSLARRAYVHEERRWLREQSLAGRLDAESINQHLVDLEHVVMASDGHQVTWDRPHASPQSLWRRRGRDLKDGLKHCLAALVALRYRE
jgi:hypothetical protein